MGNQTVRTWISIGCLIGFGLFIFYLWHLPSVSDDLPRAPPETIKAKQQTTTTPVPIESTLEPTWTFQQKWSGRGYKNTEAVELSGESRIDWWFKADRGKNKLTYLSVIAESIDSGLGTVVFTTDEPGSGESYLHQAGRFCLDISSMNCDWEISLYVRK